jgi:starvation-inducible outer membrane lipoprotein
MKMILLTCFLLAGCSTTVVPVTMKFPDAPQSLMATAQDLNKLPTDKKIEMTDIVKTTNENAKLYYELKIKYEAWQEWYREQKSIADELKK